MGVATIKEMRPSEFFEKAASIIRKYETNLDIDPKKADRLVAAMKEVKAAIWEAFGELVGE